jgi:hypothetical protein
MQSECEGLAGAVRPKMQRSASNISLKSGSGNCLLLLVLLIGGFAGCQRENGRVSTTLHLDSADDRIFQKKLECSKLLTHLKFVPRKESSQETPSFSIARDSTHAYISIATDWRAVPSHPRRISTALRWLPLKISLQDKLSRNINSTSIFKKNWTPQEPSRTRRFPATVPDRSARKALS